MCPFKNIAEHPNALILNSGAWYLNISAIFYSKTSKTLK